MQAFPIDQYKGAHTLAKKTQAVEVKSTGKHLDSSPACI